MTSRRVESWGDASDAERAHRILRAYTAFESARQADVDEAELASLWRRAAPHDPEVALEWWNSDDMIGVKLRSAIGAHELPPHWTVLPPEKALDWWGGNDDHLALALQEVVPQGLLVAMWHAHVRQQREGEALLLWLEDSSLGEALRASLPDGGGVLEAAWRHYVDDDPVGALADIWMEDSNAREGLSPLLAPRELADTWRRAVQLSPGRTFECLDLLPADAREFITAQEVAEAWRCLPVDAARWSIRRFGMFPVEIKQFLTPEDLAKFWCRAIQAFPRYASEWLDLLPTEVELCIFPRDLLPVLQSENDQVREQGLLLLARARGGRGIPI